MGFPAAPSLECLRVDMRALVLAVVLAGALLLAHAPVAAACPAGCFVDVATLGEAPATGQGVFRFPQAIAYTPGGSAIFVADQFGAVVQRFDRSGAWQGDIGYYADGREVGRIGVVGGLATDRNGHVYVLDSENDRVQVFRASDGEWLAAWGSTGQGDGQFRLGDNTGAGGLAIDHPSAGATPVAYVADQYNHRIQAFRLEATSSRDPSGPVLPAGARTGDVVPVPTPSAGWGSHGNCADTNTCATDAFYNRRLSYPQGIAVDSRADGAGRRHVFVADDRNHRVVEYLPDGSYVNQVGSFGTAAGQFRFPYDVGVDARDPRQLYVADNNNHRVQAFDAATLSFVRGWGAFGSQPGHLEFVRALAALADDPVGGVAVADTANNRVQTFSADGQITAAWGIAGRGPGYVTRPGAVAIDSAGTVHVADTVAHRIERLDRDGAYLGQTGYIAASSGFAAPNSGAGQFDSPNGVAFAPQTGRIWVADTANHRVQELTAAGAWVATHGGAGSGLGQFQAPRAVAVGADGAVLVADTGNARVQRRDPTTGSWSIVAAGGPVALSAPAGVAGAADGSVYASDGDRVVRLAGAASSVLPAPAAGALKAPGGLARHGSALYVADTGTSRVLRHDLGTGAWDVFGTEGRGVGQFVAPTGVAVDPAGESLVVADTGNDRLQRFRLSGAAAPQTARVDVTVAGSGQGLVRSDPPGILCPTDCRQGFSRGRAVTLTAAPASGTTFLGWSGPCSGTGTCQIDPANAGSVTATFSGPAPVPPAVAPPPAPGPTPPPPSSGSAPARPPTTTAPGTTSRPGTGSNPSRDRRAPVLSAMRLTPRRIVAARRGTTARIARTGATLRFSLSERATLTLAFDRVRGRRISRMRGTVRLRSAAGRRTLRLSGRHRGRRLPRGRYRLVISAADAAGNRSRTRAIAFTVLR